MPVQRRELIALAAAAPALALSRRASAAAPVRIGAIFPLTGNSAGAGEDCKAAIEVGQEIVNQAHPELKGLPLAASAGLPNLGGAPIETIFADHRGDPALAQTEALELITRQHVSALIGSYQSSTAMTATAVAERYGVPFVVSDSVAANITGRGFKYTFRVTPIASNFAETYMRFLKEMKQAGKAIDKLAVVAENTDYGSSVGDAIEAAAKTFGFPLAARVRYAANSPDMSSEVLTLKNANPSVVVFVSYTSDAILFMKTMKSLNWLPPMSIGDSAGFSDPSFVTSVGDLAQGLLNRSAWAPGKPGSVTQAVNAIFRAKTGRDMGDASGRVMQAFFVLADAINRAGSAAPQKVQAALRTT
ncbi:MAG: ABC transporter substrate-binding protein, partial [Acetobacteraceae bacterium]